MNGLPKWQLARQDLSQANSGTSNASSDAIAFTHGCTVNVSDRDGRPLFRSPQLGITGPDACIGQENRLVWMSPDGKQIVAGLGPKDVTNASTTAYFLTLAAPS